MTESAIATPASVSSSLGFTILENADPRARENVGFFPAGLCSSSTYMPKTTSKIGAFRSSLTDLKKVAATASSVAMCSGAQTRRAVGFAHSTIVLLVASMEIISAKTWTLKSARGCELEWAA